MKIAADRATRVIPMLGSDLSTSLIPPQSESETFDSSRFSQFPSNLRQNQVLLLAGGATLCSTWIALQVTGITLQVTEKAFDFDKYDAEKDFLATFEEESDIDSNDSALSITSQVRPSAPQSALFSKRSDALELPKAHIQRQSFNQSERISPVVVPPINLAGNIDQQQVSDQADVSASTAANPFRNEAQVINSYAPSSTPLRDVSFKITETIAEAKVDTTQQEIASSSVQDDASVVLSVEHSLSRPHFVNTSEERTISYDVNQLEEYVSLRTDETENQTAFDARQSDIAEANSETDELASTVVDSNANESDLVASFAVAPLGTDLPQEEPLASAVNTISDESLSLPLSEGVAFCERESCKSLAMSAGTPFFGDDGQGEDQLRTSGYDTHGLAMEQNYHSMINERTLAISSQLSEQNIQASDLEQKKPNLLQTLDMQPEEIAYFRKLLLEDDNYQMSLRQLQNLEQEIAINAGDTSISHPQLEVASEQRSEIQMQIHQTIRELLQTHAVERNIQASEEGLYKLGDFLYYQQLAELNLDDAGTSESSLAQRYEEMHLLQAVNTAL